MFFVVTFCLDNFKNKEKLIFLVKEKILALGLALFSSYSISDEICREIKLVDEIKQSYYREALKGQKRLGIELQEFSLDSVKFERCYVPSFSTQNQKKLEDVLERVKKDVGEHLPQGLQNQYSIGKTFYPHDIEINLAQEINSRILFAAKDQNNIARAVIYPIQSKGESSIKVRREKNGKINVEKGDILIDESIIPSEDTIYYTLFSEVLHKELHGITIELARNNISLDNAVKMEEAIVHNVAYQNSLGRDFDAKSFHISHMDDNGKYEFYRIINDNIFPKNNTLKKRQELIFVYQNSPERVLNATLVLKSKQKN